MGPPLVSALIKLVDVPDMEYYASKGEGEVRDEWNSCVLTLTAVTSLRSVSRGPVYSWVTTEMRRRPRRLWMRMAGYTLGTLGSGGKMEHLRS